ncbi:MFS transporter [Glutamicibacter sp. M10]|nr:MFS transporter [Glutamicibacter sp. M10]
MHSSNHQPGGLRLGRTFAATLLERYSMRKVAMAALALVATGAGLSVFISHYWQLWLLWGVLVGLGTGAMALVFGSVVANRWFSKRRGLVMGLFSGANAAGQLIFLPSIVAIIENGSWRIVALVVTAFALLIIPFLR